MRHYDESSLDRLFARRSVHGRFEPNADVHLDEREGTLVIHFELAGADADSLRVALDDGELVVAGMRPPRDVHRETSLLRKEIQYGEFVTRVQLPVVVDERGSHAVYRDGILTIRLPLAASPTHPVVRTEILMTVRKIHA